jgi:hypothetical protein
VAILPQLFMLQKQGGAESLTGHYILLLGLYRLFYILNWIYRYATEPHYMQVRAEPPNVCPGWQSNAPHRGVKRDPAHKSGGGWRMAFSN